MHKARSVWDADGIHDSLATLVDREELVEALVHALVAFFADDGA